MKSIEEEVSEAAKISARWNFTLGDWIFVLNREAANDPVKLRSSALLLRQLQNRLRARTPTCDPQPGSEI